MPLDYQMRGKLEEIIDLYIKHTPTLVAAFRRERQRWGIQNAEEFIYGFVLGSIHARIDSEFDALLGRGMSHDELDDVDRITLGRTRQIKDAIFNAG